MTEPLPPINQLPPRNWRQWWRQTSSLFRIGVWGFGAFVLIHGLLAARIVIGWQEDAAIKSIRRHGAVTYVWESESVERFPLHHLLLAGLLGRSNHNVTKVWLDDSATDEQLQQCQNFPHLARLWAVGSEVTSSGLTGLWQCPRLRHLSLADTDVDDEGVRSLTSCQTLESLDLSGTLITDACIPSLAKLPSLELVSLRWTDVTAVGTVPLKTPAPYRHVKVNCDSGSRLAKTSIRWSNGEVCERLPQEIEWHVIYQSQERLDLSPRSVTAGIEYDRGRSAVQEAMERIVRQVIRYDDGSYAVWFSSGELSCASVTFTIFDKKPSTNCFEFQMPITRAEAMRIAAKKHSSSGSD